MPHAHLRHPRVHSSLASDPTLSGMLQHFVEEMPRRVAALRRIFQSGDRQALERAVHQLKGASGSYGFEPLSFQAYTVETLIKCGAPPEEVTPAVSELIGLCRRLSADPEKVDQE